MYVRVNPSIHATNYHFINSLNNTQGPLQIGSSNSTINAANHTERVQNLPNPSGCLKENAKKIIYAYCGTIEAEFKKIDSTVSLRDNYLSMDLIRLEENERMNHNDRTKIPFGRWKEVGEKFNEDELIKQITEANELHVMKKWLIEVSLQNALF